MVKDVETFILLLVLFVFLLLLFNARKFVRQKLNVSNENLYTKAIKIVSLIVCAICMVAIYYIK